MEMKVIATAMATVTVTVMGRKNTAMERSMDMVRKKNTDMDMRKKMTVMDMGRQLMDMVMTMRRKMTVMDMVMGRQLTKKFQQLPTIQ